MTAVLAPAAGHVGASGISSAFGTFGELLQGVDEDGVDFLVTLPISCWSTATFVTRPSSPGITVSPAYKHKAVALARAMLTSAGFTGGGRLVIGSAIPEGKGLASSSADLVATARAVGNAFGVCCPGRPSRRCCGGSSRPTVSCTTRSRRSTIGRSGCARPSVSCRR